MGRTTTVPDVPLIKSVGHHVDCVWLPLNTSGHHKLLGDPCKEDRVDSHRTEEEHPSKLEEPALTKKRIDDDALQWTHSPLSQAMGLSNCESITLLYVRR